MKKLILSFALAFLAGCQSQPNLAPPIARIRIGMQQYEVEEIYGKQLTFVSIEPIPGTDGYSKGVYRIWSNRPDDPKAGPLSQVLLATSGQSTMAAKTPFKLTFVICPPLTAEQCKILVAKQNATEPNTVAQIMALVGHRPSQLLKIEEDTAQIAIEAAQDQARAIRQNSDNQSQQLDQIKQQMEQQRNEQFIKNSQDEFNRMQQQNRN